MLETYAVICLLLVGIYIRLTFKVIYARRDAKISTGAPGGTTDLSASIGAHRNFTENTCIFLFLLNILTEFDSTPVFISSFGIAFILARLMHALGMLVYERRPAPNYAFRKRGMQLTLLCMICLIFRIIFLIVQQYI